MTKLIFVKVVLLLKYRNKAVLCYHLSLTVYIGLSMKISKDVLSNAVDDKIISTEQADQLYAYLSSQEVRESRFSLTHVLYYFGGLIAIGAMTLFMNLGWESFGPAGVFFISLLYASCGLLLTNKLSDKNLAIPAGISATFVICLIPLLTYSAQSWAGWLNDEAYRGYFKYIEAHWLYMELSTLLVGAILLRRYRYPFMVMPVAVTLWFLSMDLSPLLFQETLTWELRKFVSMYFGLLMIGLAFWVDIRSRKSLDYAYWIYLFGVIAFWSGLSAQSSTEEWSKFIYFLINILLIASGVLLSRKVFVLFGALGVAGYVGHLSYTVFGNSPLFPFVLTGLGGFIIYLGILWQRHEGSIRKKMLRVLPLPLTELIEKGA